MKQTLAFLIVVLVFGIVPAVGYGEPPASVQQMSLAAININTAPAEELQELPGIGPVLAERVVQYRQEHGPFKNVDQIKEVKGVGEALFEKVKDRLTL
ncbi:MAG TPA: helix-hairpin-helix domain-containing protein [bacterium]